jgi:hypothetical protein
MTKSRCLQVKFKFIFTFFATVFSAVTFAQQQPKNDFWENVQFGGGFGLSVGSGFTNISIAPSAIYNFNEMFAAGFGLQGSYVKVDDLDGEYISYIYGGTLIGLVRPLEKIQLSIELEQLRVNQEFPDFDEKNNFWNTALYLGAGYFTGNVTVGIRYNVLFNKNDLVYSEAFMPFVRVYF